MDWRCAGCGGAAPERLAQCDCPTNVVYARTGTSVVHEWKAPHIEDVVAEMHEAIDKLRPSDRPKAVKMLMADLRSRTEST